jgi:hypothetical protein
MAGVRIGAAGQFERRHGDRSERVDVRKYGAIRGHYGGMAKHSYVQLDSAGSMSGGIL